MKTRKHTRLTVISCFLTALFAVVTTNVALSGDGPEGEFVRAYVNTLQQTFRYVYLAPTNPAWRDTPRTTFVVIGSDTPLDRQAIPELDVGRDDRHLRQLLMSVEDLSALLAEEKPATLTDEYAPVDQMLAPLFRSQVVDAASNE